MEAAGEAGFRFVTLWPTHFEEAVDAGLRVADMRSILADNDVAVSELDPLCSWLPGSVSEGRLGGHFHRYTESDFYRIADALGARSVNVFHAGDERLTDGEVVESLAALSERAWAEGLIVSLEFMAWTPIRNFEKALDIVRAVGSPDCGVNLDSWHHFRTGGSVEEIERASREAIVAVQLSDVLSEAWADPLAETAHARQMPGDGAGRAGSLVRALDRSGVRVPINLEVFSDELSALAPSEAARRLFAKARAAIEE